MLRSAGLQEEISIHLQVIGDMSYAWTLLAAFVPLMQQGIKKDTELVVKLRATFLKVRHYSFGLVKVTSRRRNYLGPKRRPFIKT